MYRMTLKIHFTLSDSLQPTPITKKLCFKKFLIINGVVVINQGNSYPISFCTLNNNMYLVLKYPGEA